MPSAVLVTNPLPAPAPDANLRQNDLSNWGRLKGDAEAACPRREKTAIQHRATSKFPHPHR
jgi:hypothetical protein